MFASSLRHPQCRRTAILALPALVALTFGLAACGGSTGAASPSSPSSAGSGANGSAAPSPSNAATPAGSGTALAVKSTSLGTILTNGEGFTVYAFDADNGTMSNCTGACLTAWPPVIATGSTPQVGSGVTKSLVGVATQADGTRQLTYAGRPLYLYAGDSTPGATTGDGSTAFGARWDALTPSGKDATSG